MKHSGNRPTTDLGLLILRVAIGLGMAYHGAQKLFGWPIGGWWTTDTKSGENVVTDLGPTIPARMKAFAGTLDGLGIPYPEINAWVAACTEFGGGLLVAIGLLCRFGAAGLAIAMGVAAYTVHRGAWDARAHGMEYPAILACAALALVFTGAGRFSVDCMLFGRKDPYDD